MFKYRHKALLMCQIIILSCSINAQQKIVSAGGSVTEILYALGLGEQIIAVDSSSYYPFEAQKKPQIGYFRTLSAEGVLALKPTLIAAANGAGPDEVLAQIAQTGIDIKVFRQEIYTIKTWQKYMMEIGKYFDLSVKANSIVDRVMSNLENIQNKTDPNQEKLDGIFIMNIGDRGPLAAGKNTVPDMLLSLANFNNLAAGIESFKPFSTEKLIAMKPDMIVMPSHVVERMGGKTQVCENQIIQMATQHNGCNILVMDALLALGFGTRIDEAVNLLSTHEISQ